MSAANIEIIIRVPANSPVAKEIVSLISKSVESQPKIEVKQVTETKAKKELTPEEQKKLQELKTLLEIAKARGQENLVKETEAQIKELEG
ncbi:MAG: hypothetical protein KatS3mg003_0425 [Candidatus Nitrosocaldaceae archaeon]|nr:MAG: hypothetical protein KatS3mg003_0425 [Candidatus Nitrosocaldaceae archaeon]